MLFPFLLRGLKDLGHDPERLLAEYRTRGIVRRVYDDRRNALLDSVFKRRHERLHIVACRRNYQNLRSGIFGKHLVFGENGASTATFSPSDTSADRTIDSDEEAPEVR